MNMDEYAIREARPDDLELLPAIELAAAALFADRVGELGISRDVLETVKSVEDHRSAQMSGCVLVAVDRSDKPVGFALVIELDGALHLDELDVAPEHGRRGIGTALLEELFRWGKARGFTAVTLSTFRDIPWNKPFYARMGFVEVDPQYSPGLAELIAGERERGLTADTRVVMHRSLV